MMAMLGLDKEHYYRINIGLCNKWMEEDGMSHLKIENPQ